MVLAQQGRKQRVVSDVMEVPTSCERAEATVCYRIEQMLQKTIAMDKEQSHDLDLLENPKAFKISGTRSMS